ncbi:MAG: DNA alkylation repair protein [Pikeienuella sp.]
MRAEDALAALKARADKAAAARMAAYHKADRTYLGLPNPEIAALVAEWRGALDLPGRVALADALWRSDIFEARVAAAKLLVQARIRDDEPVWRLVLSWAADFDSWAIADHAADVGARRLAAAPERLEEIEPWTRDDNLWIRRAALTFTLPWAKSRHPDAADLARRERVLGWAAGYAADREWFIQKAVAWWLRTLSKHDPARVRAFLEDHGGAMKPFARREAAKYL